MMNFHYQLFGNWNQKLFNIMGKETKFDMFTHCNLVCINRMKEMKGFMMVDWWQDDLLFCINRDEDMILSVLPGKHFSLSSIY